MRAEKQTLWPFSSIVSEQRFTVHKNSLAGDTLVFPLFVKVNTSNIAIVVESLNMQMQIHPDRNVLLRRVYS